MQRPFFLCRKEKNMKPTKCEIRHSERGECYEMLINGEFYGNYDSVFEAAKEFEELMLRETEGVAS